MSTEKIKTKQNGASFNKKELKRRITEFVKMGTAATVFTSLGYIAGVANRPKPIEDEVVNNTEDINPVEDKVVQEQVDETQPVADETDEPIEEANVSDDSSVEPPIDDQQQVDDQVPVEPQKPGTTEEEIAENITAIEIDPNDLTLQNFFDRNNLTPIAHQQLEIDGNLRDVVFLRNDFGQDFAMIDYDGNGIFDLIIDRNYTIVAILRDNAGHDLGYTVDDVLAYLHDLIDGSDYIAGDFIDDPSDDLLADITDPTTQEHPSADEIALNDEGDLMAQNDTIPTDEDPYDEPDVEDNLDDDPYDEADEEDNLDENYDAVDVDDCVCPADDELIESEDLGDDIDDIDDILD